MSGRDIGAQPLVSGAWLAAHLNDPNLRIIEVSSAPDDAEYRRGHIPGALRWSWKVALWHAKDREFPTPKDMALRLGQSGVAPDTTLCRLSHRATLVWFALTYALGYRQVRIYDGSWTE